MNTTGNKSNALVDPEPVEQMFEEEKKKPLHIKNR